MSIRYLHLGIIWLKTIATEVIATGTTAMAHIVGLNMVTSICISLVGLSRAIIIETKQMVLFQFLKHLKHRSMLTKHRIGQW
jgi:hypothetical protein